MGIVVVVVVILFGSICTAFVLSECMKDVTKKERLREIAQFAMSRGGENLLSSPESAPVSGWRGFCNWDESPEALRNLFKVRGLGDLVIGVFFDFDMQCSSRAELEEYLVDFLWKIQSETGFELCSFVVLIDKSQEYSRFLAETFDFPLEGDCPEFIHLVLFQGNFSELPEKLGIPIDFRSSSEFNESGVIVVRNVLGE